MTVSVRTWEETQISVFSKWINIQLQKRNLEVKDLRNDFSDGVLLINLLEIVSNQDIGQRWHQKPKSRYETLENCNLAIDFLTNQMGVRLVNVGGSDIVDKNLKLTLGLSWSIIKAVHIEACGASVGGISTAELLLHWVQTNISEFPECQVTNFSKSWNTGLPFCALISHFIPEALNYDQYKEAPPAEASQAAMDALRILGVGVFLEPADICVDSPDDKSILTQVAELYRFFSDPDNIEKARMRLFRTQVINERIAKLVQESSGEAHETFVKLQNNVNQLQEKGEQYCDLCEKLFDSLVSMYDLYKNSSLMKLEPRQISRPSLQLTRERHSSRNIMLLPGEKDYQTLKKEVKGLRHALEGIKYEYGHGVFKNLNTAAQEYQKAADQGNAEGLFSLGRFYERGIALTANIDLACQMYQTAADSKHPAAINNLGSLFINKKIVSENPVAEGMKLFKKAADLGLHAAMCNYAACVQRKMKANQALKEEIEEAVSYLKTAANTGYPKAMNNLAYYYDMGIGVEKDSNEAQKLYFQAAREKNPFAIFNATVNPITPNGTKMTEKQIANALMQGVELGSAPSMNNAGVAAATGFGMQKDEAKAASLFKRAAELDCTEGIVNYANMVLEGKGIQKDVRLAAKCYNSAAKRGNSSALNNLGAMFAKGYEVRNDINEALKNINLAAKAGHPEALLNMGKMYLWGLGVEKNSQEALKYFNAALQKGKVEAQQFIDEAQSTK